MKAMAVGPLRRSSNPVDARLLGSDLGQRVLDHGVVGVLAESSPQFLQLLHGETAVLGQHSARGVVERVDDLRDGCCLVWPRHGSPSSWCTMCARAARGLRGAPSLGPETCKTPRCRCTGRTASNSVSLGVTCAGRSPFCEPSGHPRRDGDRPAVFGYSTQRYGQSGTAGQIGTARVAGARPHRRARTASVPIIRGLPDPVGHAGPGRGQRLQAARGGTTRRARACRTGGTPLTQKPASREVLAALGRGVHPVRTSGSGRPSTTSSPLSRRSSHSLTCSRVVAHVASPKYWYLCTVRAKNDAAGAQHAGAGSAEGPWVHHVLEHEHRPARRRTPRRAGGAKSSRRALVTLVEVGVGPDRRVGIDPDQAGARAAHGREGTGQVAARARR